jgi:hypothetical protein
VLRFDCTSGRTEQILGWTLGQGPEAGTVRILADGAAAFVAHGQIWVQSREARAVPVPLALLMDAGHAALGVSAQGRHLLVERWIHGADGRPRLAGLMNFPVSGGPADSRAAGAYWRIFRAGGEAGSVRGELAVFVHDHAGQALATLASEYLKELRAADLPIGGQHDGDYGRFRRTEVF